MNKNTGTIALITIPALLFTFVFGILILSGSTTDGCNPTGGADRGVTVDPKSVPNITIGGYGHAQLVNAAYIISAGAALDLGLRDQTIAVMTAMGESGLRVLNYGDRAGPDSRGLFQQRNGWGSLADRMDPFKSATLFYKAMMRAVPEDQRASLAPTIVAHRTQINADPYHYEPFWDTAVVVVQQLSGKTTALKEGTGGQVCSTGDTVPGELGKDGWARPGSGPVNSEFGPRGTVCTPAGCFNSFHTGLDLEAGGCGGPIWAAHDGTVSNIYQDSLGNWVLVVDHGSNVATQYLHMYRDGILVKIGQKVRAGKQIARTGSSGNSTGCHLHFEVVVRGKQINPRPFLADVGITY